MALRSSQAWLLEAVHGGSDFVGVAATGAGKSTVWLLPAAVAACALLRSGMDDTSCPPLEALVIVPLASQGPAHEAEADDFKVIEEAVGPETEQQRRI